jgi:asparagine synthase (glutamine-hydrolysing)
MCGIAGIFFYRDGGPVDAALLARMSELVKHRGPDDSGVLVTRDLGLAHRRLSIVDLSPAGHQPMGNEDGSAWLVYNGEIYNHQDFRESLRARGHRFRGHSDGETLLHLVEEEGAAAFSKLAGIFGFAFWEARTRKLYLVRDPLGVKQVYWHDDGERVIFASEIKALLADPSLPAALELAAVNQYLHFHTPVEETTFFRGIRLIPPGHYLEVSEQGVRLHRYSPLEDYTPASGAVTGRIEGLRSLLREVTASQLMSDVRVGCFLSGGIDSSSIATFASQAIARDDFIAFGCYYPGSSVTDERPFAAEVAKALAIELAYVSPEGEKAAEILPLALWHQDEPKIGTAMLSMWFVSELAARSVKTCLGGQGGDEIFAGYARFSMVHPLRNLWAAACRRFARGGDARVKDTVQRQVSARNVSRMLGALHLLGGWEKRYFDTFASLPEEPLLRLFRGDRSLVSREKAFETFHDLVARCPSREPFNRALYWDMKTYLPGLFAQDDRISMAHGLETRVPMADPRVVAYALTLPPSDKLNGLATKWILKQAVAPVIPEWVLNRKKEGFATPLEEWLDGPLAPLVREALLSEKVRQRGLMDAKEVASWVEGEKKTHPHRGAIVWKLLNIELWHRIFLDREYRFGPSASGEDPGKAGAGP